MPTDKMKLGLESEFIAAAWLSKLNYSIYWKTCDNDPIDLIAVNRDSGETLKIDVKTVSRRKTWKPGTLISRMPSEIQKKLGVIILYVDRKNNECKFADSKRSNS